MAFLAHIKFALENMPRYTGYHEEDIQYLSRTVPITAIHLSSSGGWEYADIDAVATALRTTHIDVAGAGCDTCGFGASIHVRGIPHPFPCAECDKPLGIEVETSFCSEKCLAAHEVRAGLVTETTFAGK